MTCVTFLGQNAVLSHTSVTAVSVTIGNNGLRHLSLHLVDSYYVLLSLVADGVNQQVTGFKLTSN